MTRRTRCETVDLGGGRLVRVRTDRRLTDRDLEVVRAFAAELEAATRRPAEQLGDEPLPAVQALDALSGPLR